MKINHFRNVSIFYDVTYNLCNLKNKLKSLKGKNKDYKTKIIWLHKCAHS